MCEKLFQGFTNFEKITPNESNMTNQCIWCKSTLQKNKAHIFSKKIINSNQFNNYLKQSVCQKCNSNISMKVEDWLFKFTPIGTWSQQYFEKGTIMKNFKFIPNYAYFNTVNEWLLINHDEKSSSILHNQLILINDELCQAYFKEAPPQNLDILEEIYKDLENGKGLSSYKRYVSDKFPSDFNPRAIAYKGNILFVGGSEATIEKMINKIINRRNENISKSQKPNLTDTLDETLEFPNILNELKEYRLHYKWSVKKYIKYCMKIAFEALCLLEGADFCLKDEFDGVRNYVLNDTNPDFESTILYVDGKGFSANRLTLNGWVAASLDKNNPLAVCPTMYFPDSTSHDVIIYNYGTFIAATIKLFNIELAQIILSDSSLKLKKHYAARYDFKSDILTYFAHSAPPPPVTYEDISKILTKNCATFFVKEWMIKYL